MIAELQPAWILHRRAYRDSSLLLEVFTQHQGRLPIVAKGARKRKGSNLDPFRPLLLNYVGRGDVKTLRSAESTSHLGNLSGEALTCGLYINELMVRLLPQAQPHLDLFQYYSDGLDILLQAQTAEQLTRILRRFECQLLSETGYGLLLTHTADTREPIRSDWYYEYPFDTGPIAASSKPKPGLVGGEVLIALASGELNEIRIMKSARDFMRTVIDHRLDGRPLHSRRLWRTRQ